MYGSWTENVVLWRIFQESVETYKIFKILKNCSFKKMILRIGFKKII